MNLFPISFITNESEMTSENVIKLLINIQHSAEPHTKGEIFDNTMYLCYLHLYQQENPLNETFQSSYYKEVLDKTIKDIIKHPEIIKIPKNYLHQIHALNLDTTLNISLQNRKLSNIIEFNLHDYYVEQLNTKKFENIDFKTMKHLYYHYKNENGIGFKNGSVKNKNNAHDLINYYKDNKPNDILKLLDTSELPLNSYNALHSNTLLGLFNDFREPQFFNNLMDSITQTKLELYSFEILFSRDYSHMNKIFNYLISKVNNDFIVQHSNIKLLYQFSSYFEAYLEPEILNNVNNAFNLTLKKLVEQDNPNFITPHFILSKSAAQSFETYDIINQKYEKDAYLYQFKNNSIKNCLYDNLYTNFNYFNIINIYDNLKNHIFIDDKSYENKMPSKNDLHDITPLTLVNFLRKKNPSIEDFELLFNVLANFYLNKHLKSFSNNEEQKAQLEYTVYSSDSYNNIFSFISEYIRNEPLHIQTYFSDILKEAIGEYPPSENNLINDLREHSQHLNSYIMEQAHRDTIALENHILESTISKNENTQGKKIKF